ncbi:XisI protein [Roseofilum casamattae]|uniref:XisI protein n=1 Tax=Roseofilum casamattae BLCC-M143 TaxID=3022442 RepID=A0ABT7C144_9CYAN|nr:XisI protein [Roseofilum casamattae]MDJ1185171.1 XisI protein [Roseofilum casamattae BLCC-M143]
MDILENYRELVRNILLKYAGYKPSNGNIEPGVIFDLERDRYELMHVGWDGQQRIHGSVVHIDIIDSKIWIQHDGTNIAIAEELVELGVPAEDIILGFHPPNVRQYTDFGVA